MQFIKESIVRGHLFGHHGSSNTSCSQIMFQLNGTALPSLALENFQEVENLNETALAGNASLSGIIV
jgi:hypothetical protein